MGINALEPQAARCQQMRLHGVRDSQLCGMPFSGTAQPEAMPQERENCMSKTKSTKGFIVACMTCHGQIGERVYTLKGAKSLAEIHIFGGGNKDHTGHEVTITPTRIVTKA